MLAPIAATHRGISAREHKLGLRTCLNLMIYHLSIDLRYPGHYKMNSNVRLIKCLNLLDQDFHAYLVEAAAVLAADEYGLVDPDW